MRMHLGAQHFRDDDSSRSARRLLFNRACCLLLILFLSSLVLLERARRACPPCFLKGARPRASHDRDTTPLHRPLARLWRCAWHALTLVTRAWETTNRRNVQGCCVHPCVTARFDQCRNHFCTLLYSAVRPDAPREISGEVRTTSHRRPPDDVV